MRLRQRWGSLLMIIIVALQSVAFAQGQLNDFVIIPKDQSQTQTTKYVEQVSQSNGSVRDTYNEIAYGKLDNNVGAQLWSWIITRDTILDYLVYLIRFMSQIWLVIGAASIIYTWYQFAAYSFSWQQPKKELIVSAIEWVLIIAFSYAIIRIVTEAFIT